ERPARQTVGDAIPSRSGPACDSPEHARRIRRLSRVRLSCYTPGLMTILTRVAPLILAGVLQAGAPTVDSAYPSLCNGRDLTGWKIGGPQTTFKVVDGAIEANGNPGAAHLYYDGPFKNHLFQNFDLRLDVRAKNKSNGGIYILTEFQDTGFPAKGFEVQLNNSHTDRIRTGSLYHVVDLSYIPAKDDEWFPMEIMVKGQTVTISVKGNKVVEWT